VAAGIRLHSLLPDLAAFRGGERTPPQLPSGVSFLSSYNPNKMKNSLGSTLLFVVALSALGISIAANPPGGVRWGVFIEETASWMQKGSFLISNYILPGALSCFAISMFQLQSRIASSGANKRTIFAMCLLASGTMLTALRWMAYSPSTTAASYVTGMALGYTVMSRLYAVRMQLFFGRVRVPWPVWRGNFAGVHEIDELARLRRGATPIGM
jgi:hypothetical protein